MFNFTKETDSIISRILKESAKNRFDMWKTEFIEFDPNESYEKLKKLLAKDLRTEVIKDENGYTYNLDIPGFEKSEIKVKQSGSTVNINAKNEKREVSHAFDFNPSKDKLTEVSLTNGVLSIRFNTIKKDPTTSVEFEIK